MLLNSSMYDGKNQIKRRIKSILKTKKSSAVGVVVLILSILVLTTSCVIGGSTTQESNANVLARVDDYEITQEDVSKIDAWNQYYEKYSGYSSLARNNILQMLIEERVIYIKSVELGVAISDEELDEMIQNQIEGLKDATNEASEILKEYVDYLGLTLDEYILSMRERYRDQFSESYLRHYYVIQNANNGEPDLDWDKLKAEIIDEFKAEGRIVVVNPNEDIIEY